MDTPLGLGKQSRQRLSELLRRTKGTVSVEQASDILDLSSTETAKLLARWATQGWLARVRRGLYVPVPLEARSTQVALEDPWIIADRLFSPCYIGGWSAAEHWGLTEQIFRSVLVMSVKKPRDRRPVIKGTPFVVRSISKRALFGTRSVWRGEVKVDVSDPSKTVLDMMADVSLGGGLRPSADVLQSYLASDEKDVDVLVTYTDRLKNGAAVKRLGYLLERLAPSEERLIEACKKRLTKGNIKLDPALSAARLVTAWRLWVPESWATSHKSEKGQHR
ncbi:MAG TPA: type IV toxin-antitoxin system AbiEi family antitoxin domain-containing protein [Blastocatellia bacterium]|nr:type IV toxin-antitoxin system AbiEi family antitoxin domain-containing protein [Blastocatellia bacterium]